MSKISLILDGVLMRNLKIISLIAFTLVFSQVSEGSQTDSLTLGRREKALLTSKNTHFDRIAKGTLPLATQPGLIRPDAIFDAGANLDLQDKYGNTALHYAAYCNHTEIAQALIAAGAEKNLQNKSGNTALHWAARDNHTETAQALIAAGAKINLQDQDGNTALHNAAYCNHTEIAQALIAASANVKLQNKYGKTARDIAKSMDNQILLKIFEKNEAQQSKN